MKQMKKAIALALSVSLLSVGVPPFWNPSGVRADDSDIFVINHRPNVLILLDNSESMSLTIQSSGYVNTTSYPPRQMCEDRKANCLTATVYQNKGIHPSTGYSRYQVYAADTDSVSNTEAQTALRDFGFWSGKIKGSQVQLYTGNYLNFLYCTPTDCPGSKTRIQAAKDTLTRVITNVDGVRFGLMTFNQEPPGGALVSEIGDSKGKMINDISHITTAGGNPLGGQMRDAASYYKGNFQHFPSPIQNACQPNYVILITDGLQTDTASGNAVYVHAGVAYKQDHSASIPGLQNVITHTIGFAMNGAADEIAQAVDNLKQTADNGGGEYHEANNEAALEAAILKLLYTIMEGMFAFATPVVPTTSATGISRAYLAAFRTPEAKSNSPFWRGYLKAFNRNEQGQLATNPDGTLNETCTITLSDGTTKPCLAWEAGDVLSRKAPADRQIKILSGTTLVDFNTTNVTRSDLGVATDAERDHIVNFIRGVDVNDEDNDTATTTRPWKLGDIYHSTPVLVTPPFLPSPDPSYRAFRAAYASRPPILIAGANDGMLHAFRESDGEELWAFIPPNLLPTLKRVAAPTGLHQFYVDSSPIAADVKIGGTWKTIVVFGERRGGDKYYALDVTDPTAPSYLWSFGDSKISETWSEPIIGKVKMSSATGSTEKYVVLFGGGYDTQINNDHGKAVFAVDVATGQKLWEYYDTGSTTDDRQDMDYSIPGSPLALDLNNDGYIDRLYIGDVGGQLWKFDLSAPATLSGGTTGVVTNWTGKRFFKATTEDPPASGEYYPSQSIYGTPNAAMSKDGKLWLYFGTGDRNHPNNTSANRFYGIRDDQTGEHAMDQNTKWTTSDLSNATSAAPDLATTKGWYVQLAVNEKVVAAPDVFNEAVFFTTFTPTAEAVAACGTGGTAKLYAVQMLTGFAALDWAHDGAVLGSSATAASERGTTIGSGMPTGSSVSVTETADQVFAVTIAGKSDGTVSIQPAPAPANMRRILYWRERF